MEGFIFPNEVHVIWSLMIVLYPYITGLVAGAFVVSSLYHVFGVEEIRPMARFSLASAFVFLLFATSPLLLHLGHPERAFNIMLTSNMRSAMAGFGYIYTSYLILVAVEIWFSMREDFIARATSDRGIVGHFCKAILFWDLYTDEKRRAFDHRIVTALAALGIPMAFVLHGYVGFLFGSLKANPWWSTPLMCVIFIFSAIVSGIAVLIATYMTVATIRGWTIDQKCVRKMGQFLWAFMIFAVSLEGLEFLSVAYKQTAEWHIISQLVFGKLFISYVILQYGVFSTIPFFLLGMSSLFKLKNWVSNVLIFTSSTMLLLQVILMRWNVVIGGQLVSKSHLGFTEFVPTLWGHEGIAVAAALLTAPFIVLFVFHQVVPLFPADVMVRGKGESAELDPVPVTH